MATRRDGTDSVKTKEKAPPSRKPASRMKPSTGDEARPDAAPEAQKTAGTDDAQGFLRAGLKAIGTVRDDVVKHQTNVIEALLGISKSAAPRAFPGLDIGLRKFEDVFDERVAAAIQRLGLSNVQEIQELREQVRRLQKRVDQLERAGVPARRKR